MSEEIVSRTWEYLMTQHNLNKGLKLYGKEGEEATQKESQQLHDMETFEPVDPKILTYEEKRKAIASLMFLTEKRDGSIKAWACADGQKQWDYTNKRDTTLPTIMIKSICITATIDAKEGHSVVIFDLPGAFLHSKNDEIVIMFMTGKLAELMVHIAPQIYRQYTTTSSQGGKVLYMKIQKASYSMLKSALLFYQKLRDDLE